jgi:phage terminase large subunit
MTVAAVIQRTKAGFTPYGGAARLMYCRDPEVIIGGPYDTGKTIAAITRLHLLLCKYANARAMMLRKTYQSLVNSAVVTYEQKVLPAPPGDRDCPIERMGGSRPDWYDYPNGSRLVLGGLDNPGKTLSSEYDFIYVNQAEELIEDEWQALTRAASGRAGHAPYAQVMGDCNPDVPDHWIRRRKRLTFIESRHEDNPTLFDPVTGECIAPERIAALDAMTGVRHKRGRLGLWVGREGQVYEFDPAIHLIDATQVPPIIRYYLAIDFGYSNPFICQRWGEDSDGRIYLTREIYRSQMTINQLAPQIKEMTAGLTMAGAIADHDAEDRATLAEHGIDTIPADKRVKTGIDAVIERLKVGGDGKPRLYIVRDATISEDERLRSEHRATSTEREFPGYVWPETKAGRAADELPVKSDDHGMDALRYMVMYLDGGGEATIQGVRYDRYSSFPRKRQSAGQSGRPGAA